MALVYSDTEEKRGGMKIDLNKINPNNPYAKHVASWFFLKFMLVKGTTIEKIQASKELIICERKLAFWYKHPMFSIEEAGRAIKEQQKLWKEDYAPGK